jgi:hypothetical protein
MTTTPGRGNSGRAACTTSPSASRHIVIKDPMKRRRMLQSLLAVPALAATPTPAPAQATYGGESKAVPETLSVAETAPDLIAKANQHFFQQDQFAALDRLGAILMPGSREAEAPRFLEFLISQSPADRQSLYAQGLDRLNTSAKKTAGKPFAELSDAETAPLLAILRAPRTYEEPSDPMARFLLAAKEDFFRATVNSRAHATAMGSRSRGSSGLNYYYGPVE